MKRIISFIIALVICIVFSGCSKEIEDRDLPMNRQEEHTVSGDEAIVSSDDTAADDTQSLADDITPSEDITSSATNENFMEFTFSSGAGAWGTSLTLYSDLSFTGLFHDSDMGDRDDRYPNGTVYISEFSGRFKNAVKVNEYTYDLTLDYITAKNTVGETEIKDGFLYVYEDPYGMTGGVDFILYTPNTPISELSDELLSWSPYYFEEQKDTLGCYVLCNKAEEQAFFS